MIWVLWILIEDFRQSFFVNKGERGVKNKNFNNTFCKLNNNKKRKNLGDKSFT